MELLARGDAPEHVTALEHEHVWPRVWQIACSVDHVSEPGDYFAFSYELGSGERLWIAGPHVFEVGGEVVSVSSGEALRLSCSATGEASASVVTVGAALREPRARARRARRSEP